MKVDAVKVTIRKMRKSDLSVVSGLAMLPNPHAEKEKYAKHIATALKAYPNLSFVALTNGAVVGYAQAEKRNGLAVLEDIAVEEKYQSKNIGKQLLEKVIHTLKDKGAKAVLAEVHYKCAKAIPFYYKHGFRIAGSVQDYFGVGHDVVILKLVLE